MTDATPLVWNMVKAGHYVAGADDATGYTVRRDPNASPDNRWSLRHNARKVSAHRLLTSAKRAAQTIADGEASAAAAPLPITPQVPAIAATHGEPYVRGVATAYTAQPQQQVAQADVVPLPTPAARPTPVAAVAAHYRETHQWPSASEVVRRGADLDELHQALGAGLVERQEQAGRAVYLLPAPGGDEPLRDNDVVTVTPHRNGRQFDVIDANVGGVDPELVQVFPRRPQSTEDTGRWVGREWVRRVPAEVIEPLDEGDDEQAECDGHESLNGADMGESVYCDGNCLNARGPVRTPAPPAEVPAPFAVGALLVRKSDTLTARVWRVTGCETRGGVTPAPYVTLVDPFNGETGGCYASAMRTATLAEGLRTSAPEQYREVLVHLLTPHGFTAPTGPDRLVLDLPDDGAFLIHDPTGVALCTMREALRIAYPATHAGEGDGDVGTAWLDLTYGTSYETVADVAAGLARQRGQASHDEHLREVADQLRDWSGPEGASAEVWLQRDQLRELADRLAAPRSECRAAGYARRTTAVMHGLMVTLYRLAEGDEPVDPNALRGLAMRTADLMTTPEVLGAEAVAEHLAARGVGAALVADESVLPADVDGLVASMQAAGYTLAPEPEFVGGRRVRYLTPPAAEAVAPPTSDPAPSDVAPAPAGPAYDFRPGDVWRDDALRVTWHVRQDTHGEPELFEPDGPGRVPADALRQTRGGMRLRSRVMHDEREIPFEFDGEVLAGYVAGWCGHRVAVSEWRAGFRVCERCPTPDDDQAADDDVVLDGPAERPLTQAQTDSAECGKTFTAGRMGHTFPCARPPHADDDGIGCSVQRHPRPAVFDPNDRSPYVGHGADGARRSAEIDRNEADTHDTGSEAWQRCMTSAASWDEQADRIEARDAGVDDELPAGTTLLGADELLDAGGFLACGCHGTAREHSCGASAPETFDPDGEV